MSGKKGKRGRIVGNPFHPERYLTSEEVNFFEAFKQRYAGLQALEIKRGIITLRDALPLHERRKLNYGFKRALERSCISMKSKIE